MIVRLPATPWPVSVNVMPKRLICLFMAFAMLFCGVILPASAQVLVSDGHAVEGFELAGHGAFEENHPQQNDSQDAPCHATAHHHCSLALRVEAPPIAIKSTNMGLAGWPPYAASMKSHAAPPPTQPPAA